MLNIKDIFEAWGPAEGTDDDNYDLELPTLSPDSCTSFIKERWEKKTPEGPGSLYWDVAAVHPLGNRKWDNIVYRFLDHELVWRDYKAVPNYHYLARNRHGEIINMETEGSHDTADPKDWAYVGEYRESDSKEEIIAEMNKPIAPTIPHQAVREAKACKGLRVPIDWAYNTLKKTG